VDVATAGRSGGAGSAGSGKVADVAAGRGRLRARQRFVSIFGRLISGTLPNRFGICHAPLSPKARYRSSSQAKNRPHAVRGRASPVYWLITDLRTFSGSPIWRLLAWAPALWRENRAA